MDQMLYEWVVGWLWWTTLGIIGLAVVGGAAFLSYKFRELSQ